MENPITRVRLSQTNASNAKKRKPNNRKRIPIIGISITDGSIIKFDYMTRAENSGFLQSSISKCCKDKRPTHKGYKWMYLSDYEKQSKSSN